MKDYGERNNYDKKECLDIMDVKARETYVWSQSGNLHKAKDEKIEY